MAVKRKSVIRAFTRVEDPFVLDLVENVSKLITKATMVVVILIKLVVLARVARFFKRHCKGRWCHGLQVL